jgi:hypothetical protein
MAFHGAAHATSLNDRYSERTTPRPVTSAMLGGGPPSIGVITTSASSNTRLIRARDVGLVADLFADDVRLSGVPWKPFEGKPAVLAVFTMLQAVLDDVTYVAEYEGPAGVALQVRGKVGGREFDGVQILTFDADGLISNCVDLIRPYTAGAALLEASGKYLADGG